MKNAGPSPAFFFGSFLKGRVRELGHSFCSAFVAENRRVHPGDFHLTSSRTPVCLVILSRRSRRFARDHWKLVYQQLASPGSSFTSSRPLETRLLPIRTLRLRAIGVEIQRVLRDLEAAVLGDPELAPFDLGVVELL